MKSLRIATIAIALLILASCDTLNQAGQILTQSGGGNPTSAEISLGLKEALELGTGYSADRLAAKDGYFGNLAVKLLFPPEAQKAERTLRGLGLNQLADNVILSINRAAEDAAKEAKPIFVAAIKQMTIADAVNILLGADNHAATSYFKRVTSDELRNKFEPVIGNSLNKVGATRYWGDVITRYNQIPLVTKINPDLGAYVTQKAMEGLFAEIANEELKIRKNLSARSTPLLQKVFAYADRNKR